MVKINDFEPQDWKTALDLLRVALAKAGGCTSTKALKKDLDHKGVKNAREILHVLRFFDASSDIPDGFERPDFEFRHAGRSFYSVEAYEALEQETALEAESASTAELNKAEEESDEDGPSATVTRRTNRQEEARLVPYVRAAIEEIYASEASEDIEEIAFDVHNQRPGSDLENVDILAIHWRSEKRVDVVTVEVKLGFKAICVHQAHNYSRFSNRVWIACPVYAPAADAASSLREENPALFDYVVELGIGILGCWRRQGGRYEVFPLHWPSRFEPDLVEFDAAIERYRTIFEDTGVIARPKKNKFPALR